MSTLAPTLQAFFTGRLIRQQTHVGQAFRFAVDRAHAHGTAAPAP